MMPSKIYGNLYDFHSSLCGARGRTGKYCEEKEVCFDEKEVSMEKSARKCLIKRSHKNLLQSLLQNNLMQTSMEKKISIKTVYSFNLNLL